MTPSDLTVDNLYDENLRLRTEVEHLRRVADLARQCFRADTESTFDETMDDLRLALAAYDATTT